MVFEEQGFPVEDCLEDLIHALSSNTCAILEAPPGAGKTTLIPLHFLSQLDLQGKKILILEPRRLAAKTAAKRMASLLDEKVGQTVGYRIRGESKTSKQTRIEVVTEGILTRMLQSDPSLEGVGLVIFDEFHERSLQADLGLAFCLESQDVFREDLKVLIMSATLMGQRLDELLPHAPIIKSEGRQYPLEIKYLDRPTLFDLPNAIVKAITKAVDYETGSILVFLPGEGEIRRTHDLLLEKFGSNADLIIAPLYSRLDARDQDMAINPAPSGIRKIVLATNIAETSLTIEGVRIVIDGGYKRSARFDENKAMNILETKRISRSSVEQRAGRAGRMEPGVVYRLWPEPETRILPDRDEPEILNTDLMPLCLELAQWGVKSPDDLKLLDRPSEDAFKNTQKILIDLNILDEMGGMTTHGKEVGSLNVHPRLAHMIVWASTLSKAHQKLACLIATFLEEGNPSNKGQTDFSYLLEENNKAIRGRVRKSYERLSNQLCLQSEKAAPASQAGRLLAQAFQDRIAKQREPHSPHYQLTNGKGASLKEGDKLYKSPFIVIANMGGRGANGQIYQALPLSEQDLLRDFEHRFETKDVVGWDERKNDIVSNQVTFLDRMELKSKPLQNPDQNLISQGLCDYLQKKGLKILPWSEEARQFQARMICLKKHAHDQFEQIAGFSNEVLLETLEDWLGPFLNNCRKIDDLSKLNLLEILKNQLDWSDQQTIDQCVPSHLKVPSGSHKKIDYSDPDHPFVQVKLQEMFGTQTTPTVLNGALKIRLHLLSPAGRPLQVTDDIGGFWSTSYDSVKKEMKGRYPKHPWPDDPLKAIASAKTKKHLPPMS